MTIEKPKRLAPTRDTLRELYLKSGNRCSFSGCSKTLFNAKGVFVGQICHIEGAEPGGERFNRAQTNEQRRHVSNLMLMCYDHHIETDNVIKFPVEKMKQMKLAREKMFSDIVGSMLQTVTDHTTLTDPIYAGNLKRINEILKWNSTEADLNESLAELKIVTQKLSKLPLPTQELFLILLRRSQKNRFDSSGLEVSLPEVQQATNLPHSELRDIFSILDNHGFTFDNDKDDMGAQMVGISSTTDLDWPVWADLKKFSKRTEVDLAQFIIQLDFSSLDV